MSVFFPVIELFDRLAIAEIKWQRTQSNKEELEWYKTQSQLYDFEKIKLEYEQLKTIHNQIWELEWQLRLGVEDQLGLEEIGRRAIAIRDYNRKRVELKNRMAEILQDCIRETKVDHLSQ